MKIWPSHILLSTYGRIWCWNDYNSKVMTLIFFIKFVLIISLLLFCLYFGHFRALRIPYHLSYFSTLWTKGKLPQSNFSSLFLFQQFHCNLFSILHWPNTQASDRFEGSTCTHYLSSYINTYIHEKKITNELARDSLLGNLPHGSITT